MGKLTIKDLTRQLLLYGSYLFAVMVAVMAYVAAYHEVDLTSATPVITFALTSVGLGVVGNFATKPSKESE